jgi:hypothetical protein
MVSNYFSAEMPSTPQSEEYIEEVETEEVVNFAEIIATPEYTDHQLDSTNSSEVLKGEGLSGLSQDELFEKLQNYKKITA